MSHGEEQNLLIMTEFDTLIFVMTQISWAGAVHLCGFVVSVGGLQIIYSCSSHI